MAVGAACGRGGGVTHGLLLQRQEIISARSADPPMEVLELIAQGSHMTNNGDSRNNLNNLREACPALHSSANVAHRAQGSPHSHSPFRLLLSPVAAMQCILCLVLD